MDDEKSQFMNHANSINAILASLRSMPEFRNDKMAILFGRCIQQLEFQILAIYKHIQEVEQKEDI